MSSEKSFDLTLMSGQIGNLISSLEGVEFLRHLNDSGNVMDYHDKKDYMNMIKDLADLEIGENGDDIYSKGTTTMIISNFLYQHMLLLNKYVNKATYEQGVIDGTSDSIAILADCNTKCIKPYSDNFSFDLYNIISKGLTYTSKLEHKDDQTKYTFKSIPKNKIPFKSKKDLLNEEKIMNTDNYNLNYFGELAEKTEKNNRQLHTIMATELMTSNKNFLKNMKTLVVDLYKEYYMNEITDIKTRLEDSTSSGDLDIELNTLMAKVRNEFNKTFLSSEENITNDLPLMDIIDPIMDGIYGNNSLSDSTYCLFGYDGFSTPTDSCGIKEFVEEKTQMYNTIGNSIHYDLELINRMMDIEERKINNNFKDKTLSQIQYDINEALAIIKNTLVDFDKFANIEDSCAFTINDELIKGKYQGEKVLTKEDIGKNEFKREYFVTSIKEQYDNLIEKLDNYLEVIENEKYPTDLNSDQLLDLGLISFLVNIIKNTNRYDKNEGSNRVKYATASSGIVGIITGGTITGGTVTITGGTVTGGMVTLKTVTGETVTITITGGTVTDGNDEGITERTVTKGTITISSGVIIISDGTITTKISDGTITEEFINIDASKLCILDTFISVYDKDDNTSIKNNSKDTSVKKFMFDRYNSQQDYTNFALTHIKMTCCLAILYIIRSLQTIGRLDGQIIQRSVSETPEMKLLNGLNNPIPNLEYSLGEISKIKRLRREAYSKLNQVTMSKRDTVTGPNSELLGDQTTTYKYETEFEDIFKTIVNLVESYVDKYNKENTTNKLVFDKDVILEGVINGKEFYPVTKSLIYAFDDYFNEADEKYSTINTVHPIDGIKHNVLTNHLNYLAQCIVATSDTSGDMQNMYTVAQFEKFCNKLIYYCTCITTHWTFQESQPSNNSLIANASSIYQLYGKNETKFLTKLFTIDEVELELGDSDSSSKFTFNFVPFINEEIQTIFKSTNLTTNVKYVAWLTLYCLNGYFVHLYNKDMLSVVSKSN